MEKKEHPVTQRFFAKIRAVHLTASILGILSVISCLEGGYFDTLQKSLPPGGISGKVFGVFSYVPAGDKMPEFISRLFGSFDRILNVITFPLILLWIVFLSDKKYGWSLFIVLTLIQLLTGKGIVPISITIILGIAAFFMNKPAAIWVQVFLPGMRKILSVLWVVFFILFCAGYITAIAVSEFGYFSGAADMGIEQEILWAAAYLMLGLFLPVVISGFAFDLEHHPDHETAAETIMK
ncbi:MAG: hypothetical protein A2Y33_04260 [Spirochaetes bacterium GWF1_51_8]|nr:MAG: hypothetical protein A2Y33_04260 [Spirochaetes bacterium GWF1_51_8]